MVYSKEKNIMNTIPKGFYYNFKHNPEQDIYNFAYYITGYEGGYTEDAEVPMVVYFRLYKTPKIWVRPAAMVFDDVSERVENIKKQPTRFFKVKDIETIQKLKEKFDEMYPDLLP